MKHKCKALGIFALVCFLTYLYGCQKEDDFLTNAVHFGPKFNHSKARLIKGNEAIELKTMLYIELSKNVIRGKNSILLREDNSSIDFSEIIEVIDTLGVVNYTFRVIDHPDKTDSNFFNLVYNVNTDGNEIKLLRYEMDQDFRDDYLNNIKEITDFKGIVYYTTLSSTRPCPQLVDEPFPVGDDLPNDGNTSGGTGEIGTSPIGTDPGSSGGFGFDFGTSISIFYQCTNCNRTYSTLAEMQSKNSVCEGYDYIVVITYNFSDTSEPCVRGGEIGIIGLTDKRKEECKKLKDYIDPNKNNVKPTLTYLASYAQNSKNEHGRTFKMIKEIHPVTYEFMYIYTPLNYITGSPGSIEFTLGHFIVSSVHSHPKGKDPIPSFGDLHLLLSHYEAVGDNYIPFVRIFIVMPNGIAYSLSVDNIETLNQKINDKLGHEDYADKPTLEKKIEAIHEQMGNDLKNKTDAEKEKYFMENFSDYGIRVSKSEANNYNEWKNVELINGQVVQTPCN